MGKFIDWLLGREQSGPVVTDPTEGQDQSLASIRESLEHNPNSVTTVTHTEGATAMSTIRETVLSALPSHVATQYGTHVNAVVAALEAREESALETIRTEGRSAGASTEQVETILTNAGLVQPPAEETGVESDGDFDVQAAIADLRRDVQALKSAAARAGVRV